MIEDLFEAVSEMQVDGTKCRALDGAKLDVRNADLPLRILVPVTEGEMSFVAIGTLSRIEWVLHDVCLWAPVVQGAGIRQYARELVSYVAKYVTAIQGLRGPTDQSHITGIGISMGPIAWSQAEADYWGVDITLTVEEFI